jgi:hypothetical protein
MRSPRPALSRLRVIIGAVAAILGAGCESSDLSKKTDVTSEVVICLPPDTPAPSAVVRAIWFPNAQGIGSTDASPVRVTGVLALAGDRLWFMAWNNPEHHFDMLHVIAVLAAEKIGISRMGSSAMLVIQSGNDSFDSYELMNGGEFGSDPRVTQDLYDKLQALRSKHPQTDP